ncbi:MAG: FAD:protein FMN transferase, partial [Lachnospiraceae bacterium]|nr:FAD:protein FMN transferase [Lachnospiraceae bacterium]
IKEKLTYYNNLYDIYHLYKDTVNVKTVNEKAGKETVEVSEDLFNLLLFSKTMCGITKGKTNIALGSVLSIWHTYRENGIADPENARLPEEIRLKAANEHTNIEDLIYYTEGSGKDKKFYVKFLDPELRLDVGGIAKGYSIARTCEYIKELGYTNILVSVGGNIAAVGNKPDGNPWKIGIENPDTESAEEYVERIYLNDGECIATSGDYQRYYYVNGVKYCHIIDPETLYPKSDFACVSVITTDGGSADAFSTALYLMSLEEGLEFARANDLDVLWVYGNGTKIYSDNFKERLLN